MCYIDSIWFNTCDNQFKSLLNLKYNLTLHVYNAECVSFDINDILLNMKTKTIHSFIWPVIWNSYSVHIHIHIHRDIEICFNTQWHPILAPSILRTTLKQKTKFVSVYSGFTISRLGSRSATVLGICLHSPREEKNSRSGTCQIDFPFNFQFNADNNYTLPMFH